MSAAPSTSVGLEWFAEDEKPSHTQDDAPQGITCAHDELFMRPKTVSDVPVATAPKSMQELLQQGLAYDRIALKVRTGTKRLMSPDACRARLDLHSTPGTGSVTIAPKWLRET